MFLQDVEDDMDVFFVALLMFFLSFSRTLFCVDGKIIHINREPFLHYLFPEYSIHHHLEGGRKVCEAKEHDCWFKKSFRSEKGCFPFVSGFYAYIVIPPLYVKFGKQCAST